jgi:hypothetical protein
MNIIVDSIGSVTSEPLYGGTPTVLHRVIYFQVNTALISISGELKSTDCDLSFLSAEKEVREYLSRVINQQEA